MRGPRSYDRGRTLPALIEAELVSEAKGIVYQIELSTVLVGRVLHDAEPEALTLLFGLANLSRGDGHTSLRPGAALPLDFDVLRNAIVRDGFDVKTLDAKAVNFAQDHIRILSGLYGALRPLDLMQAYRLEMGTPFKNARGKDLYAFWGNRVTNALKEVLEKQKKPVLLNLASEEYFKVLQPKDLDCPVISPVFQDAKDGKYKIISFYAKRARGLMARYVVENRITDPADLKGFNLDGYKYYAADSKPDKPVFRRAEKK